MSQLLNEMDGLEPLVNVIVIAATNKPDLIVTNIFHEKSVINFRTKLFYDPEDLIGIFTLNYQMPKGEQRYSAS